MECDLRILPEGRIVISSFTGPIKTENRYRNRDRTLSFCRENGISLLIVDTRGQDSQSTTTEIYKFAKDLATEAIGFRIAFVRDSDGRDIQFMENVAANRGCQCMSFQSFEDSVQWLEPN
jgi:hypothetical protein